MFGNDCRKNVCSAVACGSAQPFAVFSIAKHVQIVQRRIAGLVRNAFSIHGSDKALGRDAGKLLTVHVKDVGVLPIARAAFIEFLRSDSRDLAQFAIQEARILMAAPSLLIETSELAIRMHPAIRLDGSSIRR